LKMAFNILGVFTKPYLLSRETLLTRNHPESVGGWKRPAASIDKDVVYVRGVLSRPREVG
jgi:hypothetical protein